jgi:hypothetical protein
MSQYLLLIYQAEEPWAAGGPDVDAARAGYRSFSAEHASVIAAGEGLEPTSTATALRRDAAKRVVVTDGPFVETKEALGGFYLVDVADLPEAVELAKRIPAPFGGVEVRPVMVIN